MMGGKTPGEKKRKTEKERKINFIGVMNLACV